VAQKEPSRARGSWSSTVRLCESEAKDRHRAALSGREAPLPHRRAKGLPGKRSSPGVRPERRQLQHTPNTSQNQPYHAPNRRGTRLAPATKCGNALRPEPVQGSGLHLRECTLAPQLQSRAAPPEAPKTMYPSADQGPSQLAVRRGSAAPPDSLWSAVAPPLSEWTRYYGVSGHPVRRRRRVDAQDRSGLRRPLERSERAGCPRHSDRGAVALPCDGRPI
jgi:hypothetical protein